MAWTGLPRKEAVIDFAKREASPEHCREFEPITRGPLFALLVLIPLGLLAALFLVAGKSAALFTRLVTWRQAPPLT